MNKSPLPPDIDPEPAETAYTPVNHTPSPARQISPKYIAPLIALALFLPALVVSVLNRQSMSGSAKKPICVPIAKVHINPGLIETHLTAPPTEMSALAYDSAGEPIQTKVVYQWGISSIDSIGQLKPGQEIALFTPRRVGTGDIWVRAKNTCTRNPVTTSVPVLVTAVAAPTLSPFEAFGEVGPTPNPPPASNIILNN